MRTWWNNGGRMNLLVSIGTMIITAIFLMGCVWARFLAVEKAVAEEYTQRTAIIERVSDVERGLAAIDAKLDTILGYLQGNRP